MRSAHSASKFLLLLAIADNTDEEGVRWPGIQYLADQTRKKERQTQQLIRDLEASGELHVQVNAGRGHTNLYFATVGLEEEPAGLGDLRPGDYVFRALLPGRIERLPGHEGPAQGPLNTSFGCRVAKKYARRASLEPARVNLWAMRRIRIKLEV